MRCDALALSLLEFLAYKAGCPYLSDLQDIADWQRSRLARELEQIPAEGRRAPGVERRAGLPARRAAGETAQAAKVRLVHLLSQPCGAGKDRVT